MQNTYLKTLLYVFFLITTIISSMSLIFAQDYEGETFSKYYSTVEFVGNDTIKVSKDMAIKNNYDRAILPGQLEFRVGSGTQDSATSIKLDNIIVQDSFGRNITYTYREFEEYSALILDIYYPLLPDFEYEFTLEYELEFESSGIFFKNLKIPLKDSTIPIEDGRFEVTLPKYNRFTYIGELEELATIDKNTGVWDLEDNLPNSVEFEYSFIPIRSQWLRGSYLFWILINTLLFVFLVYQIRKEVVKVRENKGE